jgi:hypothetical protein
LKSKESVIDVLVRNSLPIQWPYGFVACLPTTNHNGSNDDVINVASMLLDLYMPIWLTVEWREAVAFNKLGYINCQDLLRLE